MKILITNQTSPWVFGIIVALAIFSSMKSKVPVLSSDALIKVPELLQGKKVQARTHKFYQQQPK